MSSRPPRLSKLRVRGFKSISDLEIDLTTLDILIGPNGAGKSNLIGFLRMVGYMLSSESGLANYVGRAGGASKLLSDGPKTTREIEAELCIQTNAGVNDYYFRLGYAAGDSFVFLEERCRFSRSDIAAPNERWITFDSGSKYPGLLRADENEVGKTRRTIFRLLSSLAVYQFHDTSDQSPAKQKSSVDDNRYLKSDARNIASFLFRMQMDELDYYQRIVSSIRLVAPFLDEFVFEPEDGWLILQWRERGSGEIFGPGQISDGTLRVIALLALLLQPPRSMPPMIVIDEPELGLHPAAIRIVAGAIQAVSQTHQCLVATQSPDLLNEFDASNVIVVERKGRRSRFGRLDGEALRKWLDEYRLSDLWDMNLIGGRPAPVAAE